MQHTGTGTREFNESKETEQIPFHPMCSCLFLRQAQQNIFRTVTDSFQDTVELQISNANNERVIHCITKNTQYLSFPPGENGKKLKSDDLKQNVSSSCPQKTHPVSAESDPQNVLEGFSIQSCHFARLVSAKFG